MLKIVLGSVCLCVALGSNAQNENTLIAGSKSTVAVYADPRIFVLAKNPAVAAPGSRIASIRSGRGYRVQIYNGTDRLRAMEVKREFMQQHPNVRAYFNYTQPQFRIKVGDYRSREEAAEMYRQVTKIYTPCMIVPDIIIIKQNIDDQPNTGENE